MNTTKVSTQYVIDASVVVKWFSADKEENLKEADTVRKSFREGSILLLAPDLVIYETANALLKGKKITLNSCIAVINILFDMNLVLKKLDKDLSQKALVIADELEITFYDAAYMALANLMDIPLISANPKHHKKQKNIKVIDLKDWR